MSDGMECGCVCDAGDGEPISCYRERQVKARKEHKCDECGEEILPGQQYQLIEGFCDGERMKHKTCLPCMRIRNSFCCWIGGLREELKYALGFDYVTGEWMKEQDRWGTWIV